MRRIDKLELYYRGSLVSAPEAKAANKISIPENLDHSVWERAQPRIVASVAWSIRAVLRDTET